MKNTHKPNQYEVLVMSQQGGAVRRFHLTTRRLRWAGVACGGVMILAASAFAGMLHYRGLAERLSGLSAETVQFQQERATLVSRVVELEQAARRMDRFAAKLSAAVTDGHDDHHHGARAIGTGPVSKVEWAPAAGAMEGKWRPAYSGKLLSELTLKMSDLGKEISGVEQKLHSVFAKDQDRLMLWSSLPTIWPARGFITSEFGTRRGWRWHEGIDIAAPVGGQIFASGDGVVTFAGFRQGYGRTLMIDHGYGVVTLYGHCSQLYAAEGQRVKRGAVIAAVGNSGRSTGPHLHYEVRIDGVPVDPMLYIASNRSHS